MPYLISGFPLNPSRRMIRELRRYNAAQPEKLSYIPRHLWPQAVANSPMSEKLRGVMRNRAFLVQIFEAPAGAVRLSVNRTDWDEKLKRWRQGITWDELQQLKSEAGYGDYDAVEIYPSDDAVVNVANMRHLFVLPERFHLTWRKA